ncbi:MAG: hypothetical protein RLZZ628_1954 [Bacteroidota bacterium]|jgi:predicted transcriptional regulator of viral defense system
MKKTIVFDEKKPFLTTQSLHSKKIHPYQLKQLMENQLIVKVKQGVYKWNGLEQEPDEWVEVAHIVPQGVLCLLSAAVYYELTTFVPAQYQIAIPRKKKVTLPEYPPIQLFYWSDTHYQIGNQFVMIDNYSLKIYDIEKTVCDIIKYRMKIGFDTCKEIVRNYLHREDRNLVKISEYAHQMNLAGIVTNIIKILL